MKRSVVVLSLVLLGLPIGQSAGARSLIEGQKGWDCRTMGNRTCSTGARVAELAGIIEGQSGWDCRTMGNGVCGSTTSTTEDLASVVLTPASVGTTERVSVSSDEVQGNGHSSGAPDISSNGRFVAFTSSATNLVAGDTNGSIDVFVRDRFAGTTERVNISSSEEQANSGAGHGSISASGRFVAFESEATNLVPGDTNGERDVFVRDRLSGTTERVSIGVSGAEADGLSSSPDISADGRFVAFDSRAANLSLDEKVLTAVDPTLEPVGEIDPIDRLAETHNFWDVFVHDRQTHITERVSVNDLGSPGGGNCGDIPNECGPGDFASNSVNPSISADGRIVAFESWATNLSFDLTRVTVLDLWARDVNESTDIFVRDRLLRRTERISDSTTDDDSRWFDPNISANGRFVAFSSTSVFGSELCETSCVYLHDRSTRLTERVDKSSTGQPSTQPSDDPSIGDTGRIVAFRSSASLTPDGTDGIFFRDRTVPTTTLQSVNSSGTPSNGSDSSPALNGDGTAVAWSSNATNLVSDDTNGMNDIFVHVH